MYSAVIVFVSQLILQYDFRFAVFRSERMTYTETINQLTALLKLLVNVIPFNKMGVLSHVLSFGLGIYTGIYVAQNYDVAKVDEPNVVLEKAKKYVEELLKPK